MNKPRKDPPRARAAASRASVQRAAAEAQPGQGKLDQGSHGMVRQAVAVILANPVMIEAYRAGIPGNGKAFPDGAKMAKIHWNPAKNQYFPDTTVPGTLHDVDFMVKDSTRFSDSGGWGWAVFNHDAAANTFTPGTLTDQPPQGNDAKCGFSCHTGVKARDYVFTEYGKR
ncbi:cytochrome P460 family protein [Bosea sp. 2YAB26]|uniref:cytochrome P460 family protein n=1 Tax=Bosea sp. 2YAB26 TaxID=3237478 RepID=UPI003F92F0DA